LRGAKAAAVDRVADRLASFPEVVLRLIDPIHPDFAYRSTQAFEKGQIMPCPREH